MSKYGNHKHGGYDSKKEARRGMELETMQELGHISELDRQRVFELIPPQRENGKVVERSVTYRADFTYRHCSGELIVEDVKSEFTRKLPAYVLKRKMMRFLLGIAISEV